MSTTNFAGEYAHRCRVREKLKERVGRWSGFYREWRRRGASTSAGNTGEDTHGVARAAAARGSDARDPHGITVAGPIYSLLFFFSNYFQNLN